MADKPIIFSAPMVRAILDGRKTQTRRIIKPRYLGWRFDLMDRNRDSVIPLSPMKDKGVRTLTSHACPYGVKGDRLWVRETFHTVDGHRAFYRADYVYNPQGDKEHGVVWTPSIHMPRIASRILLEITGVRVERLHEISEADAQAEGVERVVAGVGWRRYCDHDSEEVGVPPCGDARRSFRSLWKFIHGDESWNANPWVWVVEFKQVEQ